ncbi:Ras family protein, putative [Ichthyophthirius multifiliis]|uniref:Ras family protein, putative n=1 Tax=Ichthyophthirius multifiliis TaxID=5932 RepID=G0R255_ICHMU|nr:Ras family protein, putative [Ichthyophthirius multifiliis]EGR28462.1 Ras family protein, putative [Ichthyophthirius multifiliis]|eukprot:XP_004029698.1 Ras family protein, putative [Ichthyophthirius multifiliis]
MKQYFKIQNDHQYFFDEAWFAKDETVLFIPEKFIFLYNNYEEDNVQMEKTWKQIDLRSNIKHGVLERDDKTEVLAPKWKYLIRKGVPMQIMKQIILDIYKRTFTDNEMEYQIALKIVFKDQIPANFRNTPIFMQDNRPLEEIVKINILNKQGYDALKRIMWVLTEMYFQIEYNPMVIQIASMLLVFIKEEDAYCVLKCMIEDSIKLLNTNNQGDEVQRAMRWHFLMNKNDFVRFLKAFFDTLEIIWDWLPSVLKLCDPIQIWATSKDGFSLNNLYKKCENYIGKQMLILIKSDVNNAIFGVYCDEMLSLDSKRTYYGSSETFVFQLYPNKIKYESQTEDNHHCYSCKDYFTFGSNGRMTSNFSTTTRVKHKIIFLGDQQVGKSCIIERFMYDVFDEKSHSTVGVDFLAKTLHTGDKSVRLQLWDTAGQERFRSLIPSYLRDANCAIIVFDVTTKESLDNIDKWIKDYKDNRGTEAYCVLVANKIDLKLSRVITTETAQQKAQSLNMPYYEVSAKSGENILETFKQVSTYLQQVQENHNQDKNESQQQQQINPEHSMATNKETIQLKENQKKDEQQQVIKKKCCSQ